MMRRLVPTSIAAGTVTAWLLGSLMAGGCGNADFTSDTRRAWIDTYGHLAWTMIAAAEEDDMLGQAA